MYQTLTCKLKVAFRSKKICSSGNRNACKEAWVWYVEIAIYRWRNIGAGVVIPKWDSRKYISRSMVVDISVAFEKQDRPQQLYSSWTNLQEPFIKMVDNILNNLSEHVNNSDTFCNKVYEIIDNLPEDDRTGNIKVYADSQHSEYHMSCHT